MYVVIVVFITLGIMMLAGMFYNLILHQRPGIYPSKKILKQRVASLGGAGAAFAVIGIIMAILLK